MNTLIAPSILSADFGHLNDEIQAVENAGADWIHVDVMDGHFVPTITLGPDVVMAARRATNLPIDTHLMVTEPDRFLRDFADAGSDHLVIHYETCPDLPRSLQSIRDLGKRPGVSFRPETPIDALRDVLDIVDIVMIMSVNPGACGQAFIDSTLPKMAAVRKLIDSSGRDIDLQVDGGVSPHTSRRIIDAGANVLVAGSAVYRTDNYQAAIEAIRKG